MILWDKILPAGEPDFEQLLIVLQRGTPSRPTLFEFFLNERLYEKLVPGASELLQEKGNNNSDVVDGLAYSSSILAQTLRMKAYHRAGYDYASVIVPGFKFPSNRRYETRTVSANEGGLIHDRASFDAYPWPDPEKADVSILDALAEELPDCMKMVVYGPGGVLENAIEIVGYETLCYWLTDDIALVEDIFNQVGSRILRYYERVASHPAVGACLSNDDWGFKTQTMFSPRQMRLYVFPWHQRIVSTVHDFGKPALLHSCGHFGRILHDLVDMGYDGRHSYEDAILPVEEAYELHHDKFAILGGIDLDFICRSTPQQVYERAKALLDRTFSRGGYALGTGNSVPNYVPDENYFAMLRAAWEQRS